MINTTLRSAMATFGLASLVLLSSCDTYSSKTPQPNKDAKLANPYVYGEVGAPAKQSKNTYPANPDAAQNAAVIKAKLFSDNAKGVETKVDTAKAVAATKE